MQVDMLFCSAGLKAHPFSFISQLLEAGLLTSS